MKVQLEISTSASDDFDSFGVWGLRDGCYSE